MAQKTYRVEGYCEELGKSKVFTAHSKKELQFKIDAQNARWAAEIKRRDEKERARKQREAAQRDKAQHKANLERWKEEAAQQTAEAEATQDQLSSILLDSLDEKELSILDFLDHDTFDEEAPESPSFLPFPDAPERSAAIYNPPVPLLARLSKAKHEEFDAANQAKFNEDYEQWRQSCAAIDAENNALANSYNTALAEWTQARDAFVSEQTDHNSHIHDLQTRFSKGDPEAVGEYISTVLACLDIPFEYDQNAAVEYRPDERRLIVDYLMPNLDDLPNVKKVSYNKAEHSFVNTYHSAKYMKDKYESVIYQLVLRVAKAVFSIEEEYDLFDYIVINGYLETVDESTGNPISPCVLSVGVSKESFGQLNLAAIDPKAWFRGTRGVSAHSIIKATPISPLETISMSDSRFIEGYSVEDSLNNEVNLAAMDWQDFENLIRELFEEEYGSEGSEVKITQASRDGGVDAVVFDADPIRGGKIIIQAKRYTNVVGVSAVRDLYGTVVNEGAMKGILVTTAYFGNDAYEFAQNKPLTLIDGGKLLYLLEKHGHEARIDLKEAKELLSE